LIRILDLPSSPTRRSSDLASVSSLRGDQTKGASMTDYASLLRHRIALSCRCIDRIFLQGYVPKLQTVGQVCIYLHDVKGFAIPSSAAFGKIGEAYVRSLHRFAEAEGVPV